MATRIINKLPQFTETVQRILGLPVTPPTTGALQANVSTIPNPPKS